MPGPLPAAVLWDMDGTLVDTEPYWIAQEHALVESFGGTWSHEHALELVGLALVDSAAYILSVTGLPLTPEQVVRRLVDGVGAALAEQVPWRPGARQLVSGLRAAGVPLALVTMSYRSLTDVLEAALPPGLFDVVVPGDEVLRGKPDPFPYQRAAQLLGVRAQDCVAIEDSESGARAAVAAGAATIVVPSVKPVPPISGAVQLPTLAGLAPADLAAVAGLNRPAAPG
jgi:HAD superfamily hydrolase (TIGR01509 family)